MLREASVGAREVDLGGEEPDAEDPEQDVLEDEEQEAGVCGGEVAVQIPERGVEGRDRDAPDRTEEEAADAHRRRQPPCNNSTP